MTTTDTILQLSSFPDDQHQICSKLRLSDDKLWSAYDIVFILWNIHSNQAFPAFCLRSLDAIRSVEELWMKVSSTKIHFDEKTSFNPMGTRGVFFARGSLKCLPFLNQWSNCLDSSWLFLNWWILQACQKKFICTLVIILCYLILFYEVSSFFANLDALFAFTYQEWNSWQLCRWEYPFDNEIQQQQQCVDNFKRRLDEYLSLIPDEPSVRSDYSKYMTGITSYGDVTNSILRKI